MREAAANAGASSGMEKAKASMQEKVDKMKTRDPNGKEMARERKEHAEQRKQEAGDQNATARQTGGGYTTGGNNRGDARGYGDDVNRGYTITTNGTGYVAGRQVGYDNNVGYAGDTAGRGYADSTTGNQDYRSGEHQTRDWEEHEPNNAGTRRNNRVTEVDPYYGSYQ